MIQSDLAWSIGQIIEHGSSAFYTGPIADKISRELQDKGGLISKSDLANYKPKILKPVSGTYHDYKIVSMPPPSSGGVHLIQMLNILEAYPLRFLGYQSAEGMHIMVEAMRLAYADRSKHLGDPKFWEVPVEGIISKSYADHLRQLIDRNIASLSLDINPGTPQDFESEETSHYCVVDKDGNVVSNTYTLNFSFGSGLMVDGTGVLLNNEMGNFSAKPGHPDAYGLIGDEANAILPGKTPLSSMTPTIVFKDGEPFLATGSPGGSRIITSVLQMIINVVDFDMNVAEATHATRIHHQWYPDILFHEEVLSADTHRLLEAKGHDLRPRNAMGSTQSILIDGGLLYGSSDSRRPDALTRGY